VNAFDEGNVNTPGTGHMILYVWFPTCSHYPYQKHSPKKKNHYHDFLQLKTGRH